MNAIKTWTSFATLAFALGGLVTTAQAQTVEWTRQLGTNSEDISRGVSADGLGNVYISGETLGDLGGPNAGGRDAFITKYDAAGALLWTRQLGTIGYDISRSVSADGLGNVYISGFTAGDLGGTSAGRVDAFVTKYDANGTLQWTRQLGTAKIDWSHSVSADGLGNVYISGYTQGDLGGTNAGSLDAFITKYDAAGSLKWTRQLGTTGGEISQSVSADGLGNVYISGFTSGDLGGTNASIRDAFITKYDAGGTLQWTRQIGTGGYDESRSVSADGLGNVYISGYTEGDLDGPNAGSTDAFIRKYDAAGNIQWTKQLGSANADESQSVSADGLGNVYISGQTYGNLGGPNAGSTDVFITKYDASGTLLWTEQLGTTSGEISYGISADGLGNVYISGCTGGSFGGPNAGIGDAFVAKISSPEGPEPSTLLLAGSSCSCGGRAIEVARCPSSRNLLMRNVRFRFASITRVFKKFPRRKH